jgi:hypothetical protein
LIIAEGGSEMAEDNHEPMTQDQAATLKVTAKLKKQKLPRDLSKAEARERIGKELKTVKPGDF